MKICCHVIRPDVAELLRSVEVALPSVCEYEKEMPPSRTTDQPKAP